MRNLFVFILLLLQLPSYSQRLSGTITSSEGFPLIGATVLDINTQSHAHTDQKGAFILSDAKTGDSLTISYVGHQTRNLILRDLTPLTIVLTETSIELDQVVIVPSLQTISNIASIDLAINPVNSSQDVLRRVPGLFIAQHAGGGKAEQIFLRGFDIDHGTDIAVSADGLPVNMVSHAHGQGYADLHFLIPETINQIDFGKGPYSTSQGNFTTAGYINFKTYDRLENSSLKLEGGQFNTRRLVGLFDLPTANPKSNTYVSSEYLFSDGPFDSPQGLTRLNVFGKYTTEFQNHFLTVQGSAFTSSWNASGQIPDRAVESGQISWFGAIDDTEGGQTSRRNLSLKLSTILNESTLTETQVFYSNYDFELYSNFTFFLDDPENGDQIKQRESRSIYGIRSFINKSFALNTGKLTLEAGLNARIDDVSHNELSHTLGRKTVLDSIALGSLNESNIGVYTNIKYELGKWLLDAGLRGDQFRFAYNNELSATYDFQSTSKSILSPKLNVIYSPGRNWQLFVKSGKSFHSNDTRVILENTSSSILPAAWGTDVGTVFKPTSRFIVNLSLWYLYLQQEFVYVGDAGIVEPSGKTERKGFDVGVNYQLTDWLFADFSWNGTLAKALNTPESENYIPLAPTETSVGGLTIKTPGGFSGSIRYRYLGDRAANEDYSLTASGYTIVDLNGSYTYKKMNVGLSIQNVLDTKWKEAQFETESQLKNEALPVSEIHFTPGTPFFLKLTTQFNF